MWMIIPVQFLKPRQCVFCFKQLRVAIQWTITGDSFSQVAPNNCLDSALGGHSPSHRVQRLSCL